jgi:hypothetical protein
LRGDNRQHFPSTDHAGLRKLIPEGDIITLIETILAGGRDVRDEYSMVWFPGDNLLAACPSVVSRRSFSLSPNGLSYRLTSWEDLVYGSSNVLNPYPPWSTLGSRNFSL